MITQRGGVNYYVLRHLPESDAYIPHVVNSILKEKADILILGASKAKHGIIPDMLEDSLHLKCYNAGEDGCDMAFYDLMLQSFVLRKTPKIVIIDMAPLALAPEPKIPNYLYGLSPIADRFFDDTKPVLERMKLHSNLYRLNGFFPLLSSLALSRHKSEDGFSPLYGKMTSGKAETVEKQDVNTKEVGYLADAVQTCRKHNIRLYLYISPTYYHNGPQFNRWLANYCSVYKVSLHDMSIDSRFRSPALYNDIDHLNIYGAKLYTKSIIDSIKKDIKQD